MSTKMTFGEFIAKKRYDRGITVRVHMSLELDTSRRSS